MSRADGIRSSVQTDYFDNFGALFPGQLADFGSERMAQGVDSYPSEVDIFVGRGVVEGSALTVAANEFNNLPSPFGVRQAATSSTSADIVGIVVRTEGIDNDDAGNPIYCANRMAAVANVGSGLRVGATTTVAITHGEDVYMAVNPTNDATIGVGEFYNASGAGLVQVTGARWRGNAEANTVAVIELA